MCRHKHSTTKPAGGPCCMSIHVHSILSLPLLSVSLSSLSLSFLCRSLPFSFSFSLSLSFFLSRIHTNNLRSDHQLRQHVVALYRLLLSLESTREDAIITCIHLFHDQRICNSAGLSCLPEVRAAIVQVECLEIHFSFCLYYFKAG
jgi:hypothetical protein